MSAKTPHLEILGGGIGGLAVGYRAKQRGLRSRIFEAGSAVGGNSRTLQHGAFRYDTGAHRLHDRVPEVTRETQSLLGDELLRVDVPSRIFNQGRYVDFPLSPLNLAASLGLRRSARAVLDLLRARATPPREPPSFESLAVHRYGRTIAENFLLSYSRKLWGLPCDQLAPEIAGQRLGGLTVGSLVAEMLLGRHAKTGHLEGSSFYYPRLGIGMIVDRLAAAYGDRDLRVDTRVTGMQLDGGRIRELELNGRERIEVPGEVVSTLPLGQLVALLAPALPEEIVAMARSLRHRDLRLAVFFLDRPSVLANTATVYCHGADFDITRWSEPRNRSAAMAPAGQTSLIAEVPCQRGDALSTLDDAAFVQRVQDQLVRAGWIRETQILATTTHPLVNAYPVLDIASVAQRQQILAALAKLPNLHLSGRNSLFAYSLMHHVLAESWQLVDRLWDAAR